MGWTEGEVSEVLGQEDLLFQSGSQSYQVPLSSTLNLTPYTTKITGRGPQNLKIPNV